MKLTHLPLLLLLIVLASCQSAFNAARPSAEVIHQRAIVIDTHADIEIPGKESRYVGEDGKSKVAPDKVRAGGVDVVVMAVAVGPMPRTPEGYRAAKEKADAELESILALTADSNSGVVLATSPNDIISAHESGQGALVLGFQNGIILGKNLDLIDEYFDAGVRVFALTHMGHNDYADSSRPLYIGG